MTWSFFHSKPKTAWDNNDDIVCFTESYWEFIILTPLYVSVLSPDSLRSIEDDHPRWG